MPLKKHIRALGCWQCIPLDVRRVRRSYDSVRIGNYRLFFVPDKPRQSDSLGCAVRLWLVLFLVLAAPIARGQATTSSNPFAGAVSGGSSAGDPNPSGTNPFLTTALEEGLATATSGLPDLARSTDNLSNLNPSPGGVVTASLTVGSVPCLSKHELFIRVRIRQRLRRCRTGRYGMRC